jgi:tricarballylate dehydrogenase
MARKREVRCDVVVVGGGSAAFAAAVAARDCGAKRVIVVEKAPQTESGGNAMFSHTGFRFVNRGAAEIREFLPHLSDERFAKMHFPPYTAEHFLRDLIEVTQGRIDRPLAQVLVDESNAAVHWMRRTGIAWDIGSHIVVDGELHFSPGINIHPTGGGRGQIQAWREIAERRGIDVRYESPVAALLGNARKVKGVRIQTADGDVDVRADAVILCAGGFQANREMRAKYLRGRPDFMKVRGSRHDTGEVLQMALALGARSAGEWQGAHATPIDAGSPEYEVPVRSDGMGSWTNRYHYQFGITVNRLGQRFFDEGEAHQGYTYAKTGAAVLEQPGGVAFQIFDRIGIELMKPHAEMHLETKVEAATLDEIATALGIAREPFLATVAAFNAAVSDARAFDATKKDGRQTDGIVPPKTNWATAIAEPPFRGYPITGGATFTFGGLETTTDAQVVGVTGRPIENLYAVGDIMGLFFHNYPAFTGQTRNVVFARRAAQHAARPSGTPA